MQETNTVEYKHNESDRDWGSSTQCAILNEFVQL